MLLICIGFNGNARSGNEIKKTLLMSAQGSWKEQEAIVEMKVI